MIKTVLFQHHCKLLVSENSSRNFSYHITIFSQCSADSDCIVSEAIPSSAFSAGKRVGAVPRKDKKVYRKKVSRSNSPTYASDQGKESYSIQTSPKKTKLNKRRFKSQNKFEFRTSSSTESLGSTRCLFIYTKTTFLNTFEYFSSLRLLSQSQISSNSSSDESQEGENCQEPVTSPPAKNSSSSTSTSKTSSPLGSLTLLSLPTKPKSNTRQRQQRKKTTPPLMRTPPLSTNSSDSFASNQVVYNRQLYKTNVKKTPLGNKYGKFSKW